MKKVLSLSLFASIAAFLFVCKSPDRPAESLQLLLHDCPSITGNGDYIGTPYVTAGDRLYLVGHQDGTFPDLGWHIEGEMGGIWDHPIKLMDGFSIGILEQDKMTCLDRAKTFINYPVGNKLVYNLDGDQITIARTQFVPDGMEGVVIELQIQNQRDEAREFTLVFNGMVDLRPTWLADSLGIVDGPDLYAWEEESNAIVAKDSLNDWFVAFGANRQSQPTESSGCTQQRKGKGPDASFNSKISVKAHGTATIRYFISGSHESQDDALATMKRLKDHATELLNEKIERYRSIESQAKLSVPDTAIAKLYEWVKYNTDWLIRDVEGVGRGLSAGLPDYPWWFGADNCYTLQGLLSTGRFDEVKTTIDLIYQLSEKRNGNGRVVHEVSTNGVTYNPGNLNETPHFAVLIWQTYAWTGDREFLEKYYPFVKKGLHWLESQDHDGNGYPDGAGMMEIPGLHSEMIDVAVYTQQAYQAASLMAKQLGDSKSQQAFEKKSSELRMKINEDWWSEGAESFVDFKSSKQDALALINQAIVRADTLKKPWAVDELKQTKQRVQQSIGQSGFVVHHNWVVNTPMEMHVAEERKAQQALATARAYTNRFGMYVTGIDRDENVSSTEKWKSFSYVGAVMTLPTGVQAISEASYGNQDQSLDYLKMLNNSFSYALPGSLYEVSPDYGMFVQAWTIYAVAVPIVDHFFGVKPAAYEKRIIIQPDMPAAWHNASLSNVAVGENAIGVVKTTSDRVVQYSVSQSVEDWTIVFRTGAQTGASYEVNGKVVEPTVDGQFHELLLTGIENNIKILVR